MGLCQSEEKPTIKTQPRLSIDSIRNRYQTVVLDPNLGTILEENQISHSETIQSHIDYISQNPSTNCSVHCKEIKHLQTIKLMNPVRSNSLYSHAFKINHMNEVTICSNINEEHDVWEFITDHPATIRDGNIVQLRHKLTQTFLSAKKQMDMSVAIGCVKRTVDSESDDEYWKLELNTEFLTESSYIKIKHFNNNLYLTRTNKVAAKDQHRSVNLQSFDIINSLWVVEHIQQ